MFLFFAFLLKSSIVNKKMTRDINAYLASEKDILERILNEEINYMFAHLANNR